MAITGNCRCVFGPHFSFSFKFHHLLSSVFSLFGHSNRLLTTLAETNKTVCRFTHRWVEEQVCCVAQTVHRLWFFWESRYRHRSRNTANAAGFHQWAMGSITIVLPHSAIDSDLTDIYLTENLQDYIFNILSLEMLVRKKQAIFLIGLLLSVWLKMS